MKKVKKKSLKILKIDFKSQNVSEKEAPKYKSHYGNRKQDLFCLIQIIFTLLTLEDAFISDDSTF